ncbi:MAG: N-acetylmuramoyl-L-alanine amidase, partial [Ignavibacteriaceae bacterium]
TGLALAGCYSGSVVYYELPAEFRNPEKKKQFIVKYSPYLKGKKIFLDPGHGGSDRRNKGYQGITVEADANLNVALALRDFLLEAGAVVIMSRSTDATVDLKERSYMADRSGADIFISIHHNAPADSGNNWTNYTATYYHAKETDYEYEPSERDMARYVQRDLAYAMRNSGGPESFDGTYSDYMIYPGQGFSVLRVTQIPSILVECGFHTNTHEEKRLAIEEFNRIEAWGIFRGLARYFAAGIPEIKFTDEDSSFVEGDQTFNFLISDSSGIDPASVFVYFDSSAVLNFTLSESNPALLSVSIPGVKAGKHIVRIIAANNKKNHAFPFHKEITVLK